MRLIITLAGRIEFASDGSIAPDKRVGWQVEIANVLKALEEADRVAFAAYARSAAECEDDKNW